jgi:hypothetical protein
VADSTPPLPNGVCDDEISPESYPPTLPPSMSYGFRMEQKMAYKPPGTVSSLSSRTVWPGKQMRWLCFLCLAAYNLIVRSQR